jgi:hypothetical protein
MTVEADAPAILPKRPTIAKETLVPKSPPPSPASPDHESIDDTTSRIEATEDPVRERLRQQRGFEEPPRIVAEQELALEEQQLIRKQYAIPAQSHVAGPEIRQSEMQGQLNHNSYRNVSVLSFISVYPAPC